jgi:SagB-type dehydrogenase family enzyme
MSYRVHPWVFICARRVEAQRSFVIDVQSSSPPFLVDNRVLVWAIIALPESFTKEEALFIWSQEPESAELADDLWSYLTSESLIFSAELASPLLDRLAIWDRLGWEEAGVYHEGTRDYPFVDMSRKDAFKSDNERMQDYETDWPAPDCYRSFSSIRSISLEKVDQEVAHYLNERKLIGRSIVKDLSIIFDFTFGQRFRLERQYDEQQFLQLETLRKSIPSGGGRHPTEAFMLVFTDRLGLDIGLYHYNVKNNSLDLLRKENLYTEFHSSVHFEESQAQPNSPDAAIVFTSLCERAMWRYRESRSWRAVILDVGHAEQMCRRICATLELKLKSCIRFDERAMARLLGLDPFSEPVLSIGVLSIDNELNCNV